MAAAPLLTEFIAGRREAGHGTGLSMLALRPMMEYLRATAVVPPEAPARPSGPVEEAIAEYAAYLHAERGLAAGTIEHQAVLVRPFLTGRIRAATFAAGGARADRQRAAELIGRSFPQVGALSQVTVGKRNRAFEAKEVVNAFTDLERQLASPGGDTRSSAPSRTVPPRRPPSLLRFNR